MHMKCLTLKMMTKVKREEELKGKGVERMGIEGMQWLMFKVRRLRVAEVHRVVDICRLHA